MAGSEGELRWFLRNKSCRWFFLKLSPNVLYQARFRKHNKNDRSPFLIERETEQSYPIYACTRAYEARYSSVHATFCGSSKPVYKSNTREKNLKLETVEHVEKCHIKCVEASHYLKRHGRKAFADWVVVFAVIICITEQRFCAVFHPYLFSFR